MSSIDWKARAEREAAAILDETMRPGSMPLSRDTLVSLLAVAWMQGTIYGSHETLAEAERGYTRLRAALL